MGCLRFDVLLFLKLLDSTGYLCYSSRSEVNPQSRSMPIVSVHPTRKSTSKETPYQDFKKTCALNVESFDLSEMDRCLYFLHNPHQFITSMDVAMLRKAWDAWKQHDEKKRCSYEAFGGVAGAYEDARQLRESLLANLEYWVNAKMLSPSFRELLDLE